MNGCGGRFAVELLLDGIASRRSRGGGGEGPIL